MTERPPSQSRDRAASIPGAARDRLPSAVAGDTAATHLVPAAFVLVAVLAAGCIAPAPVPAPSRASSPSPIVAPPATPAQPATPARTPPGVATRLAVLSPGANDAAIAVFDDAGRVASVPPPIPGSSWISASADGRLLVTAADGRLFLADPPSAAGDPMTWHGVAPDYGGPPPEHPLSFGSLSPDGLSVAALAADFASGTAFNLVVTDARKVEATVTSVAARPDGAAPAWLPDGRLLLIARDAARDATGIVLVDPARPGPMARLEREAYAVALSADGSVAAIAGPGGRVVAGASRVLLGGLVAAGDRGTAAGAGPAAEVGESPEAVIDPPSGTVLGSLALDPGGACLAVAWLNEAGGPASVWRYRLGRDGLVAEGSLRSPGGGLTAVVAWLP